MEQFANQLVLGGLSSIQTGIMGVRAGYCILSNEVYIVVNVDTGVADKMTTDEYDRLDSMLGAVILKRGYDTANILHILWSDDADDITEERRPKYSFWIVEKTLRRVIVYENQPDEFLGIKAHLEEYIYGTGSSDIKKQRNISYITIGFMLINILVFVYTWVRGDVSDAEYIFKCGGLFAQSVIENHELYRLISCMFLHFSVGHILNNMIVLCITGSMYEKYAGHIKMLTVYMIGGVISSVCSMYYYYYLAENMVISAGASGAVFAVIGALAGVVFADKDSKKSFNSTRILLLAICSVISGIGGAGIDNMAHVSGFLAGMLLSITMVLISKRRRNL